MSNFCDEIIRKWPNYFAELFVDHKDHIAHPFFDLLRHQSFSTKVAGREGRLKSTERPRSQGPLLRANGSSSLPIGN